MSEPYSAGGWEECLPEVSCEIHSAAAAFNANAYSQPTTDIDWNVSHL